jgi:hypothetical protein
MINKKQKIKTPPPLAILSSPLAYENKPVKLVANEGHHWQGLRLSQWT